MLTLLEVRALMLICQSLHPMSVRTKATVHSEFDSYLQFNMELPNVMYKIKHKVLAPLFETTQPFVPIRQPGGVVLVYGLECITEYETRIYNAFTDKYVISDQFWQDRYVMRDYVRNEEAQVLQLFEAQVPSMVQTFERMNTAWHQFQVQWKEECQQLAHLDNKNYMVNKVQYLNFNHWSAFQ